MSESIFITEKKYIDRIFESFRIENENQLNEDIMSVRENMAQRGYHSHRFLAEENTKIWKKYFKNAVAHIIEKLKEIKLISEIKTNTIETVIEKIFSQAINRIYEELGLRPGNIDSIKREAKQELETYYKNIIDQWNMEAEVIIKANCEKVLSELKLLDKDITKALIYLFRLFEKENNLLSYYPFNGFSFSENKSQLILDIEKACSWLEKKAVFEQCFITENKKLEHTYDVIMKNPEGDLFKTIAKEITNNSLLVETNLKAEKNNKSVNYGKFNFSDDFRTVVFTDTFTGGQAKALKYLDDQHKKGIRKIHHKKILEASETTNTKMKELFKIKRNGKRIPYPFYSELFDYSKGFYSLKK